MRLTNLVVPVAAAGLLVACGSSTPSTTSGAATGSPTTSAMPTASATVDTSAMSCTDLDLEASHLPTYVHYVDLNVGTDNDSAGYFGEIDALMNVLTQKGPECAPAAADEIAALWSTTRLLRLHYLAGTDSATVASDNLLLAEVRAKGIAAWKALGYPTVGWESLPTSAT